MENLLGQIGFPGAGLTLGPFLLVTGEEVIGYTTLL
jgi:hypothetical protein